MAPWCGFSLAALSPASVSERSLRRRGVELDGRHVRPELLKAVVAARLGREDVQDDVEVVREDPISLPLPLDRSRPQLVLVLEALADLVDDRLRLPRVTP